MRLVKPMLPLARRDWMIFSRPTLQELQSVSLFEMKTPRCTPARQRQRATSHSQRAGNDEEDVRRVDNDRIAICESVSVSNAKGWRA
jgi:hypothetical protein